jgi:aryl-alcohol dehydrogenase-like predicted oxidoreductase
MVLSLTSDAGRAVPKKFESSKMTQADASLSGQFSIGGDLTVNRLGFGAMRITGKGIWGEPADPEEAIRTLKRVPELGVNFIDTADSYGPEVSERLIGQVLAPYGKTVVATKAGLVRTGPDQWHPVGRPEYLRQEVHMSMRRLKVERIDLWQLHRIDAQVPANEQFEAIAAFIKEGLIRHAGLSEVNVDQIKAAQKYFPVATVQNRYNLTDRASEAVLEYCEADNIGFIPWRPIAGGSMTQQGVDVVAKKYGATAGQIALAWALKRSKVMLPIPGTSKVSHLEENVAAAAISLTDEDFATLDRLGRAVA